MKKLSLFLFILAIAAYTGTMIFPSKNKQVNNSDVSEVVEIDEDVLIESGSETSLENSDAKETQFSADLVDVSGGEASGQAFASYEGQYSLYVEFKNLPETQGTDFYEGWIVRKSPQSVISTGALLRDDDGEYINTFNSEEDLTDHLLYVLTLEPDDGDPAPAEHILEGEFKSL